MNVPRMNLALLVALGCVLAAGCRSPYPLANRMRKLQPGDTWEYRLMGEAFDKHDVSVGRFQGSVKKEIYATQFKGRKVLAESTDFYDIPDYVKEAGQDPGSEDKYFVQDEKTRDVYLIGIPINGQDKAIDPPQLLKPGTWSVDAKFGFEGDDRFRFHFSVKTTVVGTATVKTPLGTFEAWKANTAFNHSLIGEWENSEWIAPQIGEPLKISGSMKFPKSDYYMIADYILVSTTVPLDAKN